MTAGNTGPDDTSASASLALRALRALNAAAAPDVEDSEDSEDVDAPAGERTGTSVTEPRTEPAVPSQLPAGPIDEPATAGNLVTTDDAAPKRSRRYGVPVAALLLLAATVFCALSAASWYRASHDTTTAHGATRDAVLRGARIDIETINTSDYRKAAEVLDSWTAVSTGALADQYRANRADAIAVLTRAKVITKATVIDAAITALDLVHSKATVIASVDVVRTPTSGTPTRTRNRFQAMLQRVGTSWRVSDLKIVSVQLS